MKGLTTRNARFSAVLLALGVAACATRPSDDVRTVAAGDRVRVWLREPAAPENPVIGGLDSVGIEALVIDGSRIEPEQILAVQVGDRGYRTRNRWGSCVFGSGNTVVAGSIGGDDLLSFIFAEGLALIGGALARTCMFPPDYWIEGRLPGQPPFDAVGPLGPDSRPATGWGSICEHALIVGVPLAALAIGVGQDASETWLVLGLLGATALSGWLQETACPRIEPGELWLEGP